MLTGASFDFHINGFEILKVKTCARKQTWREINFSFSLSDNFLGLERKIPGIAFQNQKNFALCRTFGSPGGKKVAF